ncbi:MAG: hypothetical protein V3T88_00950 [Nitrosomonadaceae bacterium]
MFTLAAESIPVLDGNDKGKTVKWLEQVEHVARKTGANPCELVMLRTSGEAMETFLALQGSAGINELTWDVVKQEFLKRHSDLKFETDAFAALKNLQQGEDEDMNKYLSRVKTYIRRATGKRDVERIRAVTSYWFNVVSGLRILHIRRKLMEKSERKPTEKGYWRNMGDFFKEALELADKHERQSVFQRTQGDGNLSINQVDYKSTNGNTGKQADSKSFSGKFGSRAMGTQKKQVVCWGCTGPHYINKCDWYRHKYGLEGATNYKVVDHFKTNPDFKHITTKWNRKAATPATQVHQVSFGGVAADYEAMAEDEEAMIAAEIDTENEDTE